MAKLTIIGTGYVGLTTGLALAKHKNKVTFLDVDQNKIDMLRNGKAPFFEEGISEAISNYEQFTTYTVDKDVYNDSDIFFVAVPTPEKEDGSSELKYVNAVLDDISKYRVNKDKFLLIIKSTVPVGTNKKIQDLLNSKDLNGEVASNPEFLSQGTALWDSLNPHRIIFGVQTKWAKDILESLFASFGSPMIVMNLESAELVKYASNAFQALKISFINEMANISESTGANIGDVAAGMSYDPVIGNKFLRSGIGYGGSCFPKDTKSLAKQAKNAGVNSFITDAIIKTNESQVLRLSTEVLKYEGRVGILGLTFKPGTDDTRETPAHYIIKELNKNGIVPIVYDPKGQDMYKRMFEDDRVIFAKDARDVIASSDNILLVTEWQEFKDLKEKDFEDKKVFDGRRIYDFAFYQIGRGYKA